MKTINKQAFISITTPTFALLLCLLGVGNAVAEVRTITATGEYRMGDNDTRTDAKRLALLDAKRLALEQAGTYVESITEVKNLDLAKEEIRAYTAGIVEVIEQTSRTTMEGETTVVRMDVTVKIDTDVVSRQINSLHRSGITKLTILGLQKEVDNLRLELERQERELATVRSQAGIETTTRKREETIKQILSYDLLFRALGELPADTTKAKHFIDQLLVIDPDNAKAHTVLGMISLHEGKHDETIREAHLTLRMQPDDYFAHFLIARALKKKGDLDGAIAQYQMAIGLHPSATQYRDLGEALQEKGEVDGAIDAFRTALRLKPNDADIHFLLGNALANKNDFHGAIAEFHSVLLVRPDDGASHMRLSTIYWQTGDFENANKEADEVIHLSPTGLPASAAYRIHGNILAVKGDRASAIKVFREAFRVLPESESKYGADILRDIGSILLDEGRSGEAIVEYRQALSLNQDNALAHLFLGGILKDQGLITEAITEFNETLRLLSVRPKSERLLPNLVHNQELIVKVQTILQSMKQ